MLSFPVCPPSHSGIASGYGGKCLPPPPPLFGDTSPQIPASMNGEGVIWGGFRPLMPYFMYRRIFNKPKKST